MATYVIGDTHGCLNTLRELLENRIGVNTDDSIYFLGDYIDRGLLSAQLVNYLIGLKSKGYNIFPIRGNHEQMLLDAIHNKKDYSLWMYNTGILTINSYIKLLGPQFNFPDDIPIEHVNFIKEQPFYSILNDKFVLVHGGLNPYINNPFGDIESILWGRNITIPENFLPGKKILFGHTPHPVESIKSLIQKPENRLIPLDAGCVYDGVKKGCGYLAALRIEDFTIHFEKNRDFIR